MKSNTGVRNIKSFIAGGLSALTLMIMVFYFLRSDHVSTDNAKIKMGNMQIAAEVSGYVTRLHVYNGQEVSRGQLLLQIDDSQYKADNKKAQSNYEFFKRELPKKEELFRHEFISETEFNDFKNGYNVAKSSAELTAYRLSRTTLIAPDNGTIANLEMKVGDFVSPGRSLFNIIDKNDIWIEANFKETEISHIAPGQKAIISVDAFHGKKLNAHVVNITPATGGEFSILPAQNTSGNWIKVVQRVQVRLEFDKDQDLSKLGSGLSADVTIITK